MKVQFSITLRPIRLAFLIPPNSNAALMEAIELATILWGGSFCPILPAYRRLPQSMKTESSEVRSASSVLSGYLNAFDVDFVVAIGDCHKTRHDLGEPVIISSADILRSFESDAVPEYGVGIYELMDHIIRTELRFEQRHPYVPVVPTFAGRYTPFLASIVGKFPKKHGERIRKRLVGQFGGKDVECSIENFWTYYEGSWLTPRSISRWDLQQLAGPDPFRDHCILYMDAESTNDVIDFWNLRAAGFKVVPIPLQCASNIELLKFAKRFARQSLRVHRHNPDIKYNATVMKGRSVAADAFKCFLNDRLLPTLGKRISITRADHYPRLWDEWARPYDVGDICTVEAEQQDHESEIRFDRLTISAIGPKMGVDHIVHGKPRFANEVHITSLHSDDPMASVLPEGGPELAKKITGEWLGHWKLSKRGLVFFAGFKRQSAYIRLPRAQEVVQHWLEARGWSATTSDSGQMILQMVKHLGGTDGIRWLANKGSIEVLRQVAGGKVISNQELRRQLHRSEDKLFDPDPSRRIDTLLRSRFIALGVEVACPTCGQTPWYAIDQLAPVVQCHQCLSELALPTHAPTKELAWSYRAIGPLASKRGAYDGFAVLLTLNLFERRAHFATSPAFGVNLRNEGENKEYEIDLFMFARSRSWRSSRTELILAECKSFNFFEKRDVVKMAELGGQFPGSVIVFATLRESLTASEKSMFRGMAKQARRYWKAERPYNPVIIVTGTELLSQSGLIETWKRKGGKHARHCDYEIENDLVRLADVTQQLYLDMDPWHVWLRKESEKRAKRRTRRKS